ncbi:MAG: helix-turn-helix transcriptional regulator [Spirochaetota bacterium]
MTYLVTTTHQLAMALKIARKTLGLTQAQAGALVGLLPKTISALENHPESCSVDSLLRLLSALNLELSLSPKASSEPEGYFQA